MLFILLFVEDTKHLFVSISNPTLLLQGRETMKWGSDKEAK
jgi:hypothetical protein